MDSTPYARESRTGHTPVRIYELFSRASDGEIVWAVEDETGGPAAMTAAEWVNLGLILKAGEFEQLPDWEPETDEDEGEVDNDQ